MLNINPGVFVCSVSHAKWKTGMNKSTRVTSPRRWPATILTALLLMQFHGISQADYSVQVGAFTDHDRANRFVDTLTREGFPATAIAKPGSPRGWILVRVGPYPNRAAAEEIHRRLGSMDIEGFVLSGLPQEATAAGEPHAVAAGEEDEPEPMDSMEDLFGMETEETEESRPYNFAGFLNSKYAYTTASPTHHSMFRNTIELRASDRVSENISWKASARGSYDAVFEFENFYSDRVEDNRRFEADIHETYMDISTDDWEFRLGRQHIIWGEMVGLFFADVVSAKDTRQWVAEDFDIIRIPQWAARAERYMGDIHAEAIWIPFMTYNRTGKPGDDFYPAGTDPLPGIRQIFRNDNQPTQELSDSAYGLRLSALKAGWDMTGFYYRSRDASPTFFRRFEDGPTPTLIFEPRHKKIHQFGGTMAKDFRHFLLRAEAIYTLDRRYLIDDLSDADGVEKQNTVDYVVGLEHATMGGTTLNFQFFQRWYTDHDPDNLFDEFEQGASFYTRKELTGRLEGELLLISSLNREDWMFRPKLKYDLSGNWWLAVGADVFGGERKGLIGGRFDDSDRIYGNIRYTF
jgi:hypothetical protein